MVFKSYYSTSEMTGPFLCFLVGLKPLCFLHPADIRHSCIVKNFMLFSPMMHLISNHKFRGNKDITPSNQKKPWCVFVSNGNPFAQLCLSSNFSRSDPYECAIFSMVLEV